MQNIALLLIFIFGIVIKVQAQTVFAPPNSVWHYGFINSDGEDGLNYTKYVTEKDTVFEGHLCSKVTSNKYSTPTSFTTQQTQYVYTANDTVFYYNFNFKKFLALYVFNVVKGDTLKFHVPYVFSSMPDTFRVVVDSIYDVTIKGFTLREVATTYLDHFALHTYTEKIGNGAFIGHHFVYTTGFVNYISCYQDAVIDTNFTDKPCEYLKTSIRDIPASDYKYLIYPNPFVNQLNIEISPVLKNTSLVLYDILGNKVFEIVNNNKENFHINTNQLYPGVYYILIKNATQETVFYKALLKT